MKLPLRPGWSRSISLFVWQACYLPEDIAVSEESEVRRVVRESLSLIAKETGALLRWDTTLIFEMKSESSPRGETLRSSGFHLASLSKARSQLQGLLNILQAWEGLESDISIPHKSLALSHLQPNVPHIKYLDPRNYILATWLVCDLYLMYLSCQWISKYTKV